MPSDDIYEELLRTRTGHQQNGHQQARPNTRPQDRRPPRPRPVRGEVIQPTRQFMARPQPHLPAAPKAQVDVRQEGWWIFKQANPDDLARLRDLERAGNIYELIDYIEQLFGHAVIRNLLRAMWVGQSMEDILAQSKPRSLTRKILKDVISQLAPELAANAVDGARTARAIAYNQAYRRHDQ